MGLYNSTLITDKGRALLAKIQSSSGTLSVTKAATGSGEWGQGDTPQSATALKSQKQTFLISALTAQNETYVYLKFIITNNPSNGALQTGYYVREIGIFAMDPDDGEILFAISTASEADYLPPYDGALESTITIEMLTEVANSSSVTFDVMESKYVYDDTTGTKYHYGINNGEFYIEEGE